MGNRLFDGIFNPAYRVQLLGIAQFIRNYRGEHTDILLIKSKDIRRFGQIHINCCLVYLESGEGKFTTLHITDNPAVSLGIEQVDILRPAVFVHV